MQKSKGEKISKSLKNYHKTNKCLYDCRAIGGFILIVAFVAIINTLFFRNVIVLADSEDSWNPTLPLNEDKEELSVADRILIEANKAKFKWPNYLLKLAWCESRHKEFALNGNNGHSIDRGVFQINNYYHREVSDECAFNVECAAKWTMERINQGYQHEWVCNQIVLNK